MATTGDLTTDFAERSRTPGWWPCSTAAPHPPTSSHRCLPEPLPQPVIDLLNAEGITVLAPTNEAIDALPTWNEISADEEALSSTSSSLTSSPASSTRRRSSPPAR